MTFDIPLALALPCGLIVLGWIIVEIIHWLEWKPARSPEAES